jgi:hypothetical protein
MKRHKDTLKSIRGFWRILLRRDIKFTSLQKAFKRVEAAQLHACKTYSMVLERHPFSVKLLRSYAGAASSVQASASVAASVLAAAATASCMQIVLRL